MDDDRFPVEDFAHIQSDNFEAYIVIHTTALGLPTGGGCRIRPYTVPGEAFRDARALARAMSYKHAIAGTDMSGAKMVVNASAPGFMEILNGRAGKEIVAAMIAKAVNQFKGRFWTAEDMGSDHELITLIGDHTPYVLKTDDPSPWTAQGVALCAAHVWDAIKDKHLTHTRPPLAVVQGYGKVGRPLANLLKNLHGWRVAVTDPRLDDGSIELADGLTHLPSTETYNVWSDIFLPCGPGETIDATTGRLPHTKMICGAANNPIANASTEMKLANSGVVYVPDFIANSGGLLCAVGKGLKGWGDGELSDRIRGLVDVLDVINEMAKRNGTTLLTEAIREAEARIAAGREGRTGEAGGGHPDVPRRPAGGAYRLP